MADLALAAIMAIWGSSFAILRTLLGGGGGHAAGSPLALVAVRMTMASALLACWMALTAHGREQLMSLRGPLLRDGTFAGALLGFGFLLQIEGLQRTSASRSGFLTGTLVVLVPVLEFLLFRKRPPAPALLGVLVAFAGMTVLSAPWTSGAAATMAGDLLTLGCAGVFPAQIIRPGRGAPPRSVLPMLLLQLATIGAMAAVAGAVLERPAFFGGAEAWVGRCCVCRLSPPASFGAHTVV